jgi:hypothetical protein
LDLTYTRSFEAGKEFVGPNYNGSFVLPMQNNEQKRDVFLAVQNLQKDLDLQAVITCDSSVVTGYVLSADVTTSQDLSKLKIDTSKYSCGDKVRIQ